MKCSVKTAAMAAAALAILAPAAYAQTAQTAPASPLSTKADGTAPAPAEPNVSLDLKNAEIRDALEKLFRQTKSDFSLDNSVQGYVTLKITNQPLESALRLLLRSASTPLTYTKEAGVYFIKPRRIAQTGGVSEPVLAGALAAAPTVPLTLLADQDGNRLLAVSGGLFGPAGIEVISLMYLDPADVADLLNIRQVPSFTRQGAAVTTGQAGTGQGNGRAGNAGNGLAPQGVTMIAPD